MAALLQERVEQQITPEEALMYARRTLVFRREAIFSARCYHQDVSSSEEAELIGAFEGRVGYPYLVAVRSDGKMLPHNHPEIVIRLERARTLPPTRQFTDIGAVRGFYFNTLHKDIRFDFLELDEGPGRKYFDHLNPEDQTEFIRRWVDSIGRLANQPQGWGVFMTRTEQGYKIEKTVEYLNPDYEKIRLRRLFVEQTNSTDLPPELLDPKCHD